MRRLRIRPEAAALNGALIFTAFWAYVKRLCDGTLCVSPPEPYHAHLLGLATRLFPDYPCGGNAGMSYLFLRTGKVFLAYTEMAFTLEEVYQVACSALNVAFWVAVWLLPAARRNERLWTAYT